MGSKLFMITIQAAEIAEPRIGTLDDPTLGLDMKSFLLFALDDVQEEAAAAAEVVGPRQERAAITFVGPNAPEAVKGPSEIGQEAACSIAILNIGGGDADQNEQAEGIHQQMALATPELFGGIVPSGTSLAGGFDALAVDNGGRGVDRPAIFDSDDGMEHEIELFEKAEFRPAAEGMIGRAPRSEIGGQQPPSNSTAQNIEDGIEHPARVLRRASEFLGFGHERFNQLPLFVGHIGWVRWGILHPHFESHSKTNRNSKVDIITIAET